MRISDWSSDVCSSDLPGIRIIELEYEVIAGRGGAGLLKHRLFMTSRVSRRTLDHDPADDIETACLHRNGQKRGCHCGASDELHELVLFGLDQKIAKPERKSTRINSSH